MTSFPKVSVFVLTYQQESLVRESLDSFVSQDYPNFEVVVGDDGSTDATPEIVRGYEARYPGRVKALLFENNVGIAANANRTIRHCDGEFIAWASGDDVWLPGKLRKQVEWFARNPDAVICYGNAEIFDHATGKVIRPQHGRFRNRFREGGAEQLFVSTTFFNGCTVMARRSAVPPDHYDEKLTLPSDWFFWVELARKGRIGYIKETLARYRQHPNNVTKRVGQMLAEAMDGFDIIERKYPEYKAMMPRMRADFLFGSAIEHLRAGQVDAATTLFTAAVRARLRGSSYAPFPVNVLTMLLARSGALVPAWRIWQRWRLR